ncbi:MAG: hypothetical protein AAF340_05965 [Pseudomonadota bacterium]
MSQPQTFKIAEIVRFRLKPGVSDADYIALNGPSHSYSSALPGFISRSLSKSAEGDWTDYVVWDSMEAAKHAADGFMAQDFAPAMVGAIDESTMEMTHQQILWQPV